MSSTPTLRAATALDLPAVHEGELRYMRDIEPEHEARWRAAMARNLEQWTANLERMFVLELEGAAAGYCFWLVDDGAAVLASIHVVPRHRGRGLGRLLLERYMEDARACGFTRLTLGVHRRNPARRLYEAAGFTPTHDDGDYHHYECVDSK